MDEEIEEVVEGEVVSSDSQEKTTEQKGDASVILSLDELIKSNIAQIDKLQIELKNQREMVNDSFQNNPAFLTEDKKVKEASKVRNAIRGEILKQPAVAMLVNKVKDARLEIKERQQALSDYVQEYQRLTGNNQVEGYDGEVREIITVAKLLKKSAKK